MGQAGALPGRASAWALSSNSRVLYESPCTSNGRALRQKALKVFLFSEAQVQAMNFSFDCLPLERRIHLITGGSVRLLLPTLWYKPSLQHHCKSTEVLYLFITFSQTLLVNSALAGRDRVTQLFEAAAFLIEARLYYQE